MPMLYILRGLPSAGKSKLAQVLAPGYVASLDAIRQRPYFQARERGGYVQAIDECKAVIEHWMKHQVPAIAVANVNAHRYDVNEWVLIALNFNYQYTVVHVETDLNDEDLAARSATECPPTAIAKFRSEWEPLAATPWTVVNDEPRKE